MKLLTEKLRSVVLTACLCVLLFCVLAPTPAFAADTGTLHGVVKDPLGAVVAQARVELLDGETVVKTVTTDATGTYSFEVPRTARYRIRAAAASFQVTSSEPQYLRASANAELDVTLGTQTMTQEVSVTATATPVPVAQIGASVTVLNAEDYRQFTEVKEPLRMIPGLQVAQVGQVGGTTGLSIRGGHTDANKVLIDDVPVNDMGGAVEFANLATVGVQKIEVLREPDSALYGSDALAGVVTMTTARGTTRYPLLTYAGDGGNFSTFHQELSGSGAVRQFDYYGAFFRLDTRNDLPKNGFHNGTYVGNFGWNPNVANDVRFTVRHLTVSGGAPNGILLYGIADDAAAKAQNSYYSAAWNNQTTVNWHNEIRYGGLRLRSQYDDFSATGILDPAGTGNFLGAPVTLRGANGYSVTGQAIFQYAGTEYPNQTLTTTDRDFVYAQTDYRLNPHLLALGGFKYEAERGSTTYVPNTISRGNYSYTLQIAGDLRNRLYYNVGSGIEENGLFGLAGTPRASLAYYLVRPSAGRWLSGTKLHASFGKGIKEPNVYQQTSSLFNILSPLPNGADLIAQYHVGQIGPENSRTYDGGVDQELWSGRARLSLTYFHDQFTNGIEFVPQNGLAALGIPAANLPAVQYGADVNSEAFRSQGAEAEAEFRVNNHLFARAGYTYTNAVVQHSFSSDQLGPSFNPAGNFGDIPIGAYSPLVGARPFRIAPHTGYFGLNYTRAKFFSSLTGTLVGQRDDSDFLSDPSFGPTMLLPNRNLDGAYQRLDLSGGYQVRPRLLVYTNIQNLLSEHYAEVFGFPSLPFTFRSGIKITFGGESWGLK
ncbi:MAG: TonB-dependent receptor [Acidobacteriota bacterium]|nr:TonB-dependent receptor [Acidobacteriota bacterium]